MFCIRENGLTILVDIISAQGRQLLGHDHVRHHGLLGLKINMLLYTFLL